MMIKVRELIGVTEEREDFGKVRQIPAAAYLLRFEDDSELLIGGTGTNMFVRALTGPRLADDCETVSDCDNMAARLEVEYRQLLRKKETGEPVTAHDKNIMHLIGDVAFIRLADGDTMAASVKAIAGEIERERDKGERDAEFEEQIKNGALEPVEKTDDEA